jgi:hypothetical protein
MLTKTLPTNMLPTNMPPRQPATLSTCRPTVESSNKMHSVQPILLSTICLKPLIIISLIYFHINV